MLAGIALSLKLWFPFDRLYPAAPFTTWMGAGAPWIDVILSLVMIGALLAGYWKIALGALTILVLRDQSRLQPWAWEYALLTLALMLPAAGLKSCRAIVIALYLWSGLQKLNATFATRTWLEVTGGHLPAFAWVAIPLGEIAIGVALMFERTRRAAVIAAIALHASIVVMLIASHENSVVWPWNIALAMLVAVLFRGAVQGQGRMNWALVAVAGVLPALSFVDRWDPYLSCALYSGNTAQAVVIVGADVVPRLPTVIARNTWQESPPRFIDLNRWSYDELNVPAYPAERVFREVASEVCRQYADSGSLRILGRPHPLNGARSATTIPCEALAGESGRAVTRYSTGTKKMSYNGRGVGGPPGRRIQTGAS
jgi:Methylamine utilisation protein MauE